MDLGLLGGRKKAESPAGKAASFFTLVAAVLFIAALATPLIYHSSASFDIGSLNVLTVKADLGPFECQSQVNDGDKNKETIDKNCEWTLHLPDPFPDQKVDVVDSCDEFNAARGFLVLAAIVGILAFVMQAVVSCAGAKNGLVRGLAGFLGILTALSGLISMALFAHLHDHDDQLDGSSLSTGFWLITVGWVLAGFAALPFLSS